MTDNLQNKINELQSSLSALKPPEQRALAWQNLALKMAEFEENLIKKSIELIQTNASIEDMNNQLNFFSESINIYVDPINKFVSRLKSRITELELIIQEKKLVKIEDNIVNTAAFDTPFVTQEQKDRYRKEIRQSYTMAKMSMKHTIDKYVEADLDKALSLASSSVGLSDSFSFTKYLNDKLSMIHIMLFQCPMKTSKEFWEREIITEIYKDWNPNEYCLLYSTKLKEVFKDMLNTPHEIAIKNKLGIK